jgi:hypothetical protein
MGLFDGLKESMKFSKAIANKKEELSKIEA